MQEPLPPRERLLSFSKSPTCAIMAEDRGPVTGHDNSRFGAAAKRRACAVGRLACASAGGGSGYFRSAETREREETIHTPERQRAALSAK